MSGAKKNVVIILGVFILLVHFFMIGNYIIKPGLFSRHYTYPYFQQNWNIFVPPPVNNYRLFVMSENIHCTDVFEEIKIQHQSNRLGGSEALLMALSNSIHYFDLQTIKFDHETGIIRNNGNFRIIKNIAVNYLKDQGKTGLENATLILMIIPVTATPIRTYYTHGENLYMSQAK